MIIQRETFMSQICRQQSDRRVDGAPIIEVGFEVNLRFEAFFQKIQELGNNVQVMLWYGGEYGLKQEGVNFYKNRMLGKLLTMPTQPVCNLYDLTAWGSLRDRGISASSQNAFVETVNGFDIPQIKCVPSSDFFRWIQGEQNEILISGIQDILSKRTFIYKVSQSHEDKSIKVGEVFDEACRMLESLREMDTAKVYSALQYIEAFYLLQRMVEVEVNKGMDEITVVFGLPGSEYRYYYDESGSFQEDTIRVLKDMFGDRLNGKKLKVLFYTFDYSKDEKRRPYNAGREVMEINDVSQIIREADLRKLAR